MRIGVPREIKSDEYRVGVIPAGVQTLTHAGHEVLIEQGAGAGSGFDDADYAQAGAKLVGKTSDIFGCDMIMKVKEPQPGEIGLYRPGQIIFTYFHFAANEPLTRGCLDSRITAIAYETIKDKKGTLPLLTPMSEVAGRMSIQEGAKYLEKPMSGRGILLGGVPGVPPAHVVILGGGVVGTNAAKVAAGTGANVVIMDVNVDRLRYLDDVMPANVTTLYSDAYNINENLKLADLVIGAVLIPGAVAPRLVRREHLPLMKNGAVIVDVAIDQGGCIETSRPTTHKEPTYIVDGVVHYCVANMPGAVGRTSTIALCNATIPYALKIASGGYAKAAMADPGLAEGVQMVDGRLTFAPVAEAFGMDVSPLKLSA